MVCMSLSYFNISYSFVDETEDITFDAAPSPQHPTQYEDGLIECRVSGQPIPIVSWHHRDRRLHTGMPADAVLKWRPNTFATFWNI